MSSAEVAIANIILPPQKDEGSPPPDTIEIQQEQEQEEQADNNDIFPDNNDSTDNILNDPHIQSETKQDQQDQPDNDGIVVDDDIEDILTIPNHHRKNVVSTPKIIPIINEIVNAKAQINTDEEKENIAQKQRVLDVDYGHCSLQGIRPSMEDQVVVEPSFIVYGSKCTSSSLSIYGVFDGHGGKQCAQYCASNLCEILKKYLLISSTVENAFKSCISELDEQAIEFAKDASGSTCCIILIDNIKYDLYCCNVGDSRCILINNTMAKVRQLSVEHKPDMPTEKQRIENANGWVTFGRVCGILAVSRSLGDKDFKYEIENLIISTPDITHHKVSLNSDGYVVLACDGLFDVFTNEQCMEWIKTNILIHNVLSMQDISDKLCHDAIYVRKSKDNVSVLVLRVNYNDIDLINNESNENNDFEGSELRNTCMDEDDVKDSDKIYNSTSSNGSVGSPNNSLQSQISNQSDDTNKPKKHKFHVQIGSDDNI